MKKKVKDTRFFYFSWNWLHFPPTCQPHRKKRDLERNVVILLGEGKGGVGVEPVSTTAKNMAGRVHIFTLIMF